MYLLSSNIHRFVANSFSLKKLPRLEHIDHVDIPVLVLRLDVLSYVGLHLALVLAIRALEPRQLAALVLKMFLQVVLPIENAATLWTRELDVANLLQSELRRGGVSFAQ